MLAHIAQRGCGVSNPRDTEKSTGHSSEQPAPGDPALSREVKLVYLESQQFCDSLKDKMIARNIQTLLRPNSGAW